MITVEACSAPLPLAIAHFLLLLRKKGSVYPYFSTKVPNLYIQTAFPSEKVVLYV